LERNRPVRPSAEEEEAVHQLNRPPAKQRTLAVGVLAISVGTLTMLGAPRSGAFTPEKAGFSVRFKEETSPYRVLGVFVMPGEMLLVEAVAESDSAEYVISASAGEISRLAPNRWRWTAPQDAGLCGLTVRPPSGADSMALNAFVMVPYDRLRGEYLNGYRIGKYPTIPLRQLPIYKPPRGFVEVTPENEETLVAPHFRLKQFVCKQEGGYPRYLVLKERLLVKLELVLEKANEKGYGAETFHVMSGYRTPYYNKQIGNVKYSRHLWGGAADIYIDENPPDGMMDDLNGDGKHDYRDAAVLYDIIDEMYGKPWYELFVGGLGRYKRTRSHGPFVHVDVRGFRARWGD
jgi:hypothetical protein